MEKMLEFINHNPWLNVLFILLTFTSIFLSFWFYFKSKKSKRPNYTLRTFNLIKEKINKIDSVEIQYHNSKIDNLSITKIALWNNGKETISSSDVAQNDPFLINITEGFTILDCDILFEKNPANGFSINKINPNQIEIKFDYFDFNEGIIVQLFHTSTDDEEISVKGSFKGTRTIERNSSSQKILPKLFYKFLKNNSSIKPRLMKRILGVTTFLVPLLTMFLIFLIPEQEKKIEPTLLEKIFMASIVALPYWWLSYRTLKRRIPKGFEIFEDEF